MLPSTPSSHAQQTQSSPAFVLVDGSYYLFRCFYGLPPLTNKDGLPTNAVRGFLNALNRLLRTYDPTHMVIAFDAKGPTFRHKISEHYKAKRKPMDEQLALQIPYIHKLIKALGICSMKQEGFEADDIIGTLAVWAYRQGHRVIISTGDKDMTQLVNDGIVVENSFDDNYFDMTAVVDKFGVYPHQIVDFLTLMGDASDGIKGVPKVGEVTAKKLLQEYGTLQNIINNAPHIKGAVGKNILAHQDHIALDKQLATIITDLPLTSTWDDFLLYQNKDADALMALYDELGFKKELASLQYQKDQPPAPKPPTTPPQTPTHYHTITSWAAFDELVAHLNDTRYFVFDTETTSIHWQNATLVGISISPAPFVAYYIPLAHKDEFGRLANQLDKHTVLDKLKPLFENPHIGKIGQHLKYDAHILQNEGISLAGWKSDTMLASYVINAAATRHNMDDLAKTYLNYQTTTFEDIAGRGKKQRTFDDIDLATASHYACEDADITHRLFLLFLDHLNQDDKAKKLLDQLEMPTAQILWQMERAGIMVNRPFLMELSARFDSDITALEQTAFEMAGEAFNLASPKQLGGILFDTLGIKGGKKTKTGQYSTSEEVLSKINHPLVAVVLSYRELAKLKNTYTDALDKVADLDGRVHTSYHQALTSTGRLSSSDPNLQNIPIRTDTGRLIRKAFIAPKGKVIMSADYSQIELRLMAHFSQDPTLLHAFQEGLDIHKQTASEILNKAIEAVSDSERRAAKAVNFGLLYGMSAFGLAKQLGCDVKDAKAYIDRYFESYPSISEYMERTKQQAINQGYVETILGRKLYTPDAKSTNRMVKEAVLRAAINAPLQGSAADIIKLAMIAVNDQPTDNATLLLQVHDELVFEVDEQYQAQMTTLIKEAMQNVMTHTAKALGFDVRLDVPLVVEVGVGDNWGLAH